MRLLFDRDSLQTRHHLRDNQRLSTLITKLIDEQYQVAFSSPPGLDKHELNDTDVLVITTRYPRDYSPDETQNIKSFIESGGGLLLMSNHADWPSKRLKDTRKNDAKLVDDIDFPITFERTFFRNKQDKRKTTITSKQFNQSHPIITGGSSGESIKSIVTNTSCSIDAKAGDTIISIPNGMVDKRANLPSTSKSFAHVIDNVYREKNINSGRVVAIADSGFIGSDGTYYPGPGLVGWADNLRFILNSILWLSCALG